MVAAALVAPSPAGAAFPGENGLVAAEARGGALELRRPGGRLVERFAPGRDPAFSPRGLRLAFARRGDVWIADADGAGARRVTAGPARDGEPAWAPGGEWLVFASGPGGARDLHRIRADGSAPQRLTFHAADDGEPAWSVRDDLAFVRRTRTGASIHVLQPSTWTVRRLSPRGADDRHPAWSPDGRRLAFVRDGALHVMRADGTGARRVIAERAHSRPGSGASSGARRVTARREGAALLSRPSHPAWSPDGRRILVAAGPRARRRLVTVPVAGGRARPLGRGDAPDWQPTGLDPVIAAAGDMGCDPNDPAFAGTLDRCHARQTSDLLLTMDLDAVLVLGDAQPADGRPAAYAAGFDPTWGRLDDLLKPVPGNHDYGTPGAAGYFTYFGPRAGAPGDGWHSFELGEWHVVALNSQCGPPAARTLGVDCAAGSAQERWLRADLAARPSACTLAFFHHPRYASGLPGQDELVRPLWQALHDAGADVVLGGHDHAYERFAPLDPAGVPDPGRGIRQFVAGTGGHSHQRSLFPEAHSEHRNALDFGVLQLILRPARYEWAFVTEAGVRADAGTGACH